MRRWLLLFLLVVLVAPGAKAQYFGRNKVQWENFKFKTLQTEHFEIYYYDQEADVVEDVGRMAERWYARLSKVFNHSFGRKPIVLYANSADFHQTTTTGGLIGEGTGGFTDAFMNRVVLPLTGDYAENDHVLGHEIVHVFQYDIANSGVTGTGANRRRFALEQLPLWVVEGMAEYFSKGRIDPLTSMWIRDATIHNRLPDVRKLTRDPRYFPYRYGQAVMAYIGGRFGDDAVVRYFLAAGIVGPEEAFEHAVGLPADQVFRDWQESARELYNPIVAERPTMLGQPLLGRRTARADLNVGPSYSPDGRYIAFLSTRELFSIDLFLADAKSGRVLRRLVSSDRDAHFESLRFIDSAGGWSPDSRKIAFVTFQRGDNYLSIVDVESRDVEHIRLPGIEALTNPVWSPDGQWIAFSGQPTGVTDLYVYNLRSQELRRLTNDKFADLQPAWSPDGKSLAFVTDRGSGTNLSQLSIGEMGIATIEIDTGTIRQLALFPRARHINPQYSPDGKAIYFIANPEGLPDIYRYWLAEGRIEQVTHVQTGVAGITEMSPAMSVAANTGDIAFSLFQDDNHYIYTLSPQTQASQATVVTAAVSPLQGNPRAAVLPPFRATGSAITGYLQDPAQGLPSDAGRFRETGYDPRLRLAYLGPPTIGIGADRYGFAVGGSVSAYFTDVLGQHNVGVTVQGGGGGTSNVADQIGGEVFYLNQRNRFNWGADLVHIPYIAVSAGYGREPIDIGNGQVVLADVYQELREITTIDDISGLAQYPFSSTRRIEASTGYRRYNFKQELQTIIAVGNQIIDDHTERLGDSFAINLFKGSAAFVGDSSVFGFVSPVRGTRYRFEVEALTGDLKFETALADYRRYFFMRPVTLALRGLHYGRYGTDAEDERLSDLFLGQASLVRGYEFSSFNSSECVGGPEGSCPVFDRLLGSRVAVASVEVRVPLFGTREFGLVNAPFIPTELMAFVDGGVAWRSGETPKLRFERNDTTNDRIPVFSAGAGARILLSYIPIEIYMAKPFQRPGESWVFGFNIIAGW